jgi:hypothetical protein
VGTWGAAPFDNDDALDLLADLDEASDVEEFVDGLRDALAQVDAADGYLEAPEVSEAIAAACLVAARVPGGPQPEDDAAADLLEAHPFEVDDALRAGAVRVLDRALERADNEWYELWVDADALDEVRAALAPYRDALQG